MKENYDNLGLFASLSRCEPDLLDMINFNFFALDSTWQLRVIDIVSELPDGPEMGDIYVLDGGIYSSEYTFQIFDGHDWVSIPVKEGNLFYSDAASDFVFLDGGEFVALGERFGDVSGPGVSFENSIARFSDNTGKVIDASPASVSSAGNIYTPGSITSSSMSSSGGISGQYLNLSSYAHASAVYIGGDGSSDGSWRIVIDGNDMVFERRESGTWVWKQKITP